jgi:hypothetical protein
MESITQFGTQQMNGLHMTTQQVGQTPLAKSKTVRNRLASQQAVPAR